MAAPGVSNPRAPGAAQTTEASGTGGAGGARSPGAAGALMVLRRAAFTGALDKLPVGENITQGEIEAQKETFWKGHVKVKDRG